MSPLTRLGTAAWGGLCYKYIAPNGAAAQFGQSSEFEVQSSRFKVQTLSSRRYAVFSGGFSQMLEGISELAGLHELFEFYKGFG